MASSYNRGELTVGFPCRGERVSSMVQDHEIYVTVPAEHLEAVVKGLEETKHLLTSPSPSAAWIRSPASYRTTISQRSQRIEWAEKLGPEQLWKWLLT